ncbi:MAG: hypothetical protein ACYDEJ_11100 [Desulfitobacteriaceae bacterium]
MDTQIINVLKQIKADHGNEIFFKRNRFNALLKDYTKGQYKGEIRLLTTALDEGLYLDLMDNLEDYSNIKVRYMMKLKSDYFWIDEYCHFTIDTWAAVAGIAIISSSEQSTGQTELHSLANMGKTVEATERNKGVVQDNTWSELENAITNNLKRADDLSIMILKKSANVEDFRTMDRAKCIPADVLIRMHELWKRNNLSGLKDRGWFNKSWHSRSITDFTSLFSLTTFLEQRLSDVVAELK